MQNIYAHEKEQIILIPIKKLYQIVGIHVLW